MATSHRTSPTLPQATAVGIIAMLGGARPSEVCDALDARTLTERGNVALMLRDLRLAGHISKSGDTYHAAAGQAAAQRKAVALGN